MLESISKDQQSIFSDNCGLDSTSLLQNTKRFITLLFVPYFLKLLFKIFSPNFNELQLNLNQLESSLSQLNQSSKTLKEKAVQVMKFFLDLHVFI